MPRPEKPILAVDCGASHLACARFSRAASGGIALEHYAVEPLPAAAEMSDTEWLAAIGAAFAGLGAQKIFQGPCLLVVPGHLTLTRVVRIPRVEPGQRERILRFEAQQAFPAEAGDWIWSHAAPAGDDEDAGADAVLSAARRTVIEELCARASAAGFSPLAVAPAWAALWSAARRNHPETAGVMVLDIGARSSHLIAPAASRFFARTIALGGNAVSRRIAVELGVDFADAERLKLRAAAGSRHLAADSPENMAVEIAADDFARRLGGDIARSLAGLFAEAALRPQRVLLSGGGSRLASLPGLLAKNLGVAVERHDPLRRIKLGAAAGGDGTDTAPPVELVGAALLASSRGPECPDLLTTDWGRRAALRRLRPWLIAATLIAMAVPWLLIFYFGRKADNVRGQLGPIEEQVLELRGAESRRRDEEGRLAEINRRTAALQRMEAMRTGWTAFLADLQERLARIEHVWLDTLQILPPEAPAPATGARPGAAGMGVIFAGRSGGHPAAGSSVRLRLAGCVFDPDHPLGDAGEGAYRRAKALLESLRASPFAAAVEGERFDAGRPGLLQFEVTVVAAPRRLF